MVYHDLSNGMEERLFMSCIPVRCFSLVLFLFSFALSPRAGVVTWGNGRFTLYQCGKGKGWTYLGPSIAVGTKVQ